MSQQTISTWKCLGETCQSNHTRFCAYIFLSIALRFVVKGQQRESMCSVTVGQFKSMHPWQWWCFQKTSKRNSHWGWNGKSPEELKHIWRICAFFRSFAHPAVSIVDMLWYDHHISVLSTLTVITTLTQSHIKRLHSTLNIQYHS